MSSVSCSFLLQLLSSVVSDSHSLPLPPDDLQVDPSEHRTVADGPEAFIPRHPH